jgi:hypothetical protein
MPVTVVWSMPWPAHQPQPSSTREGIPLGLRGAATINNHSTEIYWFGRSAAAVAMYFE